jgi:hypothetical protein
MNRRRSVLAWGASKLKSPPALSVPLWLFAGLSALALLCAALGGEPSLIRTRMITHGRMREPIRTLE